MDRDRSLARRLAQESLAAGDPLGWFERLYRTADDRDPEAIGRNVPWIDDAPNPLLVEWLERRPRIHGTACVLGSALGHDAEELSRRGYLVTGFDVSETAIAAARAMFPQSRAEYIVADLFALPAAWVRSFDFVLESYTLQVLPSELRARAIAKIAELVAPGGTLLVIARGRDCDEVAGDMPWPLTRDELAAFESAGLDLLEFEDFLDAEQPPVRRFRATYRPVSGAEASGAVPSSAKTSS